MPSISKSRPKLGFGDLVITVVGLPDAVVKGV